MIACVFHTTESPTYYFTYNYPVAYTTCYEPPEEEPPQTIRRKWWEYLATILEGSELVPPVIWKHFSLPLMIQRIHHERQYPRVVKYRNNRNP